MLSGLVPEPTVPAPEQASVRESVEGLLGAPIHGEFSNRYRNRRVTGDGKDEDLIQLLRVAVGDEERDAWTYDFMGRASEDLDGDRHTTGHFPFDELTNTFPSAVNVRLYTAAATGRGVAGLDRLRVGRQEIVDVEPFYFDGLRLDGPAWDDLAHLQLSVYGGVPVHLYETSRSGDWLAGTQISLRPFRTSRLYVQYAHVTDEFSLYGHARTDLERVRWQEQLLPALSAEASATVIDSRGREAGLLLTWREPGEDLFAQVGYRRLMDEQQAYALDVDPYVGILTTQVPYHQADVRASKGIASWLMLNADGSFRVLQNKRLEGEFNREFSRVAVTPVLRGWPETDTEWSFTTTAWEAAHARFLTYGGEVAQGLAPGASLRAGADYSLYKFDLFFDRERTHVRTYYLKLRWAQTEAIRWDIGYEREENDFGSFGRFEIAARYRF